MSYGYNDHVYSFVLSWEQPQASLVKRYKLTYYEKAGKQPDIELFDVKTGKLFLKRVRYSLPPEELFLGNQVTIFARQMTVEQFGDPATQARFSTANFLALVPYNNHREAPHTASADNATFLLREIAEKQLQAKLEDVRMLSLSRADAKALASLGSPGSPGAVGNNNTDVLEAPAVLAVNLRASGRQITQEAFEGAVRQMGSGGAWVPSFDNHRRALGLVFPSNGNKAGLLESARRSTAHMGRSGECSVCVVKAHAVQAGHVPEVLSALSAAGLQVTAVKSASLSRVEAQEFLEVYKGVVPNFPALVDELCRSRVVAIEVCGQDAVRRLRALAGPMDFSIAKQIRPDTLRARYGVDSVKNAIHVTDLQEDGVLESEYMFDILQR